MDSQSIETPVQSDASPGLLVQLFDALPGICVLVKADAPVYTIVAVTEALLQAQAHPATKEALLGTGFFGSWPNNPVPGVASGQNSLRASFDHVVACKAEHHLPVQRYDLPNGDGTFTERHWKVSNKPVFIPGGTVQYILHTLTDITSQIKAKQQEDKVRGIEKAYGVFMELPLSIYVLKGHDLVIDMANATTLKHWGRGTDVTGKPLMEALPELKGQGYDDFLREVLRTGETKEFHESPVVIEANGRRETGYYNFICKPYYEEGPEPAGIITVANEVTEKVLAKKELAIKEQRLELAAEIVGLGEFRIDITTQMGTFSQQVMEWFELPFLENTMKVISSKVHPGDRALVWGILDRSIAGERDGRHDITYRVPRSNGDLLHLRSIGQVQWSKGKPVSVYGIIQDVTEQVIASGKVEQSEAKLKAIITTAPAAIGLLVGRDLIIENPNQAFIDIVGKGPGIAGLPLCEAMPELQTEGQPFLKILDDVFTTGVAFRSPASLVKIVQNGVLNDNYYNISYSPVSNSKGEVYAILDIAIDVTAEVTAKKALEQNQEALRSTIMQAPVAMCIFSGPDYVVEIINDRMVELWGKQREDVLHKPLFEGLPEARGQGFEELLEGIYTTGETVRLMEVPVELPRQGKLETRYVNFVYQAFREADGSISRIMAVAIDATEQVWARRRIEEVVAERTKELAHANKLMMQTNKELQRSNAHLEEFAHAASHDLKEPVRKVHFFTSQLKRQLGPQLKEDEIKAFSRIENATERMGALIDDLLLYSHASQRPHEMEDVDLNIRIHRVLEDLELDIEEKAATVRIKVLPVVQGYGRQLQQLFQNLLSNALKYSKAGVPPVIDISACSREEEGKRYYAVKVEDNGIGFNQQYAEKIFQMFARLHSKEAYSGTGVGLSIVKKVVENHNGFIRVEGKPDEGSIFNIYLPADQDQSDLL